MMSQEDERNTAAGNDFGDLESNPYAAACTDPGLVDVEAIIRTVSIDNKLARLIAVWPKLDAAVRQAVVTLIEAACSDSIGKEQPNV